MAQGGAELGFADPVLDVGAAPEPALDVEDRLALLAGVVGGVVVRGDEGGR